MKQTIRRRRASGEGSIYRTADGRWRGAVAWTDHTGALRRRFVSGPTAAVVRERVASLRADLDRGTTPAGTDTLAGYLPRWLDAERLRIRPSTWGSREIHVRRYWLPELGRVRVSRLTPTDVEGAMA